MIYCRIDEYHAKDVYSMNHPKLRPFLRWAICIGSYWITALVYPYNFYYGDHSLPHMGTTEILVFFALMAVLGTVLHGLLLLLELYFHIRFQKNIHMFQTKFCLFANRIVVDILLEVQACQPANLRLLSQL